MKHLSFLTWIKKGRLICSHCSSVILKIQKAYFFTRARMNHNIRHQSYDLIWPLYSNWLPVSIKLWWKQLSLWYQHFPWCIIKHWVKQTANLGYSWIHIIPMTIYRTPMSLDNMVVISLTITPTSSASKIRTITGLTKFLVKQ